mmetsp:Transcript_70536/g.210332  ORF Transcript_70536/g.210332 Transcript_70536/m.210332 type:complete len:427 (-) Transcript_70536:134-1414(-)
MSPTVGDQSKGPGLELQRHQEELEQQLQNGEAALLVEEDPPPVRLLLIPMTCVFQGYAAYVVCQRYLKAELGVGHTGEREHLFTQATVFMHYGKLAARVGHDVVCPCYSSWVRVLIAQFLVFLAVLIPPVFVWGFGDHWVGYAYFHFLLLGIGVGVFEGTFLSVISPLGRLTKAWAIMGAPLGLALVDIIGQLCTSKTTLAMNPVYIYWYIAISVLLGMGVFASYAPRSSGVVHQQANFLKSLQDRRRWLVPMVPFFFAKLVGNFVMENTPGWFYVYNGKKVPFFSPSAETNLMDPDLYFVLIYIAVLLGDGISRRVAYLFKLDTMGANVAVLGVSVVCSLLGFALESLAVAVVTILAAFLAFWGNGLGYAVAAKYIDRYVPKEHNRAVYSMWCMIGDVGSIAGSALVDFVNSIFCKEAYKYQCVH